MADAPQKKFETLDAMRGLAAVAVMMFHYQGTILGGLPRGLLFSSGYLAVDLFFVLSGFVIAFAYDRRLAMGMGVRSFMRVRLIRLLPMIWLATLLGATYVLFRLERPVGEVLRASALHAWLIPKPLPISRDVFPMNGPSWSLFWEIIVNAIFAFLFRKVNITTLLCAIAFALLGLVVAASTLGALNGGASFADFWVGFPRVMYGFSTGILLRRTREYWHGKLPALPGWAIMVLVMLMLEAPIPEPARALYDLFAVCILAPALVALGSCAVCSDRTRASAVFLADISYPLYAIHVPIMLWVAALAGWAPMPVTLFAIAAMLTTIPLSYAVGRWYDLPVRQTLSGIFAARRRTART